MKIRYLIIITVFATIFWTVLLFPASFVVNKIIEQNPKISMLKVEGSVWNGKAYNVFFDDEEIGDVEFGLSFLQLFLTNLALDLKVINRKYNIELFIKRLGVNNYQINDLIASIKLKTIIDEYMKKLKFNIPVPVDATIFSNIDELHFNKKLVLVEGIIGIKDVKLFNKTIKANNNFKIITNNKKIILTTKLPKNKNLSFDVNIVLNPNNQYSAKISILVNNKNDPTLKNLLMLLGNNKTFNFSGKLPNINLP